MEQIQLKDGSIEIIGEWKDALNIIENKIGEDMVRYISNYLNDVEADVRYFIYLAEEIVKEHPEYDELKKHMDNCSNLYDYASIYKNPKIITSADKL